MRHPQIAAFLVSLTMAACGLAGCASAPIDRSVELLGEPTPIKAGQSPMDVLCEIRAEFMALPKPVLRRIVYHGKSSRKRRVEFGTLSTKFLSAYYEFRLTDTAQQWAKGHTVAEISAALASLVLDPEVGGEAAMMLASLATTRTSYGEEYHPANVSGKFSRRIYESGYRSPSDPGDWNLEYAYSFQLPQVAAKALSYGRFESPGVTTPLVSKNTLNYRLEALQSEIRSYTSNHSRRPRIYGEDPFTKVDTLDDWLIFNLLPPNPQQTRHQYLIGKYGVTFLVIGSSAWELPTGIAVYELGLEKYWPVVYGYGETVGDISNDRDAKRRGGRFSRYRMEYDHAVKRRVYEMAMAACEPGSAE